MAYTPPDFDDAPIEFIIYIAPSHDEAHFDFSTTTPDERASEINAKDSISDERGSEILASGTPDERASELIVGELVGDERESQITGVGTPSERASEILAKTFDERASVIAGKARIKIARTYRILVKDENGDFIGEFDQVRKLKFGKRLNNFGSASFDILATDPKAASLVSLRRYTVWIYQQTNAVQTLVWAGEQALREGRLENDGNNWITIYCYDWLEQLKTRYTAESQPYVEVDAGEIAWDLIDTTQAETNGDMGITEGSIEATIDRDRPYRNQNILEAIINLSNVLSGFDFEITNEKVFNVASVLGTDKTDSVVLEYGKNISNVQIVEDFSSPVTRAIVLGEAVDEDNLQRVDRDDGAAQALYGLREDVLSEMDVSELETLQEKGDAMLRKFSTPLIKATIDMIKGSNPSITDFSLGDAVTLIINSGIYDIKSDYRVFEWEVEFGSDNAEMLSLVLGNFINE